MPLLYHHYKRDSQCLEQIVELTEENLKENGIELEELLADGGYSSGEALAYLHEKNINATSQTSDNTKRTKNRKIFTIITKEIISKTKKGKDKKLKLIKTLFTYACSYHKLFYS